MKLKEWQKQKKISNRKLSSMVGIHESLISHFHTMRRKFSTATALRIYKITNGIVTIEELLYPNGELEALEKNSNNHHNKKQH